MYSITLLRHGESSGNANGQIQGQSDPPLTERGIEQAKLLAQAWLETGRHFDQIIASPLIRASQTASIIAGTLTTPLEYDSLLLERAFGDIEGKRFSEITQNNPGIDINLPYHRPGGSGESIVELFTRASLAIQSIVRRPPGGYLIVSHGALLNLAMYAILGVSPHNSPRSPRFVFTNTGYVDLTYNPEIQQWRIHRFVGLSATGE